MAVELKNRVESDLGLTVPVTALLQGPSLAHLSARLVTQLPELVAVSTAAVPAVAVREAQERGMDAVPHGAAEAAACQHFVGHRGVLSGIDGPVMVRRSEIGV